MLPGALIALVLVTRPLHAAQIENALKFARLLVGLHGRSSKREVQELAAWVVEAGASLHFLEDRLVALSEAAQVCLSLCVLDE